MPPSATRAVVASSRLAASAFDKNRSRTGGAASFTLANGFALTRPCSTPHANMAAAVVRVRRAVPSPPVTRARPRAQGAPPAPRRWSSTRTLSGTRRPRSGAGTASRARRSTAPTGERLPAAARPWATLARAQPPRERGARRRWGERPAACRVWSCERRHHTRKIKVASDGERRVGVGGRACTNCCRQE